MKNLLIIILIFVTASCSFTTARIKGKGGIKLTQVKYSDLNDWEEDNHKDALKSFIHSCDKFRKLDPNKKIGKSLGNIKVSDFNDVCEIADIIKNMSQKQIRNFFENWFTPFAVLNGKEENEGLFTGYYQPELKGSRQKTDTYKHPVYARPSDLTGAPYYSREEIEKGALKGEGLELLYVEDKVDLFFMHIQGTGRIILPNGKAVKLAYDRKNNHPYSSIGKYILKNKIIDSGNVSYGAIKSWLRNNPEAANDIMNINKSYIFFKIAKNDNVIGAQSVPLTSERSLAIDRNILPYGYPIWLETKNKFYKEKPFRKLLITQDTGSAIKGPVRGDIFFGKGKKGEKLASRMNHVGNYYILLPVNVVDRIATK